MALCSGDLIAERIAQPNFVFGQRSSHHPHRSFQGRERACDCGVLFLGSRCLRTDFLAERFVALHDLLVRENVDGE